MKRKTLASRRSNIPSPQRPPHLTSLPGHPDMARWEPLPASLSRWTGFVLYWVASHAAQVYAAALAPLDLSPFDVGILSLLESDGPLVQARLGDKLRIDKATMVGLLDNLERHALVERRPHPRDGRAFEVHLLQAGQGRIREAERASQAASEHFFGVLSADEQHTLHDLLARLATSPPAPFIPEGERIDPA